MPRHPLARELDVAQEAARAAGRIQVDLYERLERIVHKSEKDVVTEADHLSEEAILEAIRRAFPQDAFLAEESGHSGPRAATSAEVEAASGSSTDRPPERLWVVDPLDGTVNYANGLPFFAVSIGLVIDGRAELGVIFDPLRDELFSAVRGGAARLDGRPIRMPGKEKLGDLVVHVGLPRTGFARRNARIRKAVRITRSMGSAALALAYLANGRFDAYVQWSGLSAWDICAAGVIAEAGGALVSTPDGGPWFDLARAGRTIGIVAAAPGHHASLLRMLA